MTSQKCPIGGSSVLIGVIRSRDRFHGCWPSQLHSFMLSRSPLTEVNLRFRKGVGGYFNSVITGIQLEWFLAGRPRGNLMQIDPGVFPESKRWKLMPEMKVYPWKYSWIVPTRPDARYGKVTIPFYVLWLVVGLLWSPSLDYCKFIPALYNQT